MFFKRDANNVLGQQRNMTSKDLSRVSVVRLSGLGQWNPNEMIVTDGTEIRAQTRACNGAHAQVHSHTTILFG